MKREAKEKYAEISEAIEQAEKAELDRILDDIASGSKKRLIRIRNNESDIEMIYLRCRRIAIVLEYFRFRTPKQNAVLKKDCDDVIKMIAFNEYRLNTDKANVFEAADCVLALSDGGISKKDVVGVFSKQHPNDGTIYGENNEELPELLLNISSYLLKRGEEELALRAMRYLVECSRRRAGEGSPQHREIVASVALALDTKYPQFRYDICAAENKKFVPEPNYEYTVEDSDFYGALGLAAVSLEKTKRRTRRSINRTEYVKNFWAKITGSRSLYAESVQSWRLCLGRISKKTSINSAFSLKNCKTGNSPK